MKQLGIYLTFNGTCETALEFYKDTLAGEITSLQHFGEAPMEVNEAHVQRVMHATFKADTIEFMASDSMPEHPVNSGNQVHLSLQLDDEAEQTTIFNKLAEGGQVTMPLGDTFWNARFGMLVDKYGISWMLNCEKKG